MRVKKFEKNSLKAKAYEAKNRIVGGRWAMIEEGVTPYEDELYLLVKKYVFNNMGSIHLPYTNFDDFFDSVYRILKEEIDHQNPLQLLINDKYRSSLTAENKQRYIFFLSKKYIFIKTHYLRIKANLDERNMLLAEKEKVAAGMKNDRN